MNNGCVNNSLRSTLRTAQTSEYSGDPTVPPTLKMLHNPPQTVSMGSNEDPLPLFDLRGDHVVPVRQRPGDGVFEALAGRKLLLRQVCVATILQPKTAPESEQLGPSCHLSFDRVNKTRYL